MAFVPSPQATAATVLLDANLTAAGKPTTSAPGASPESFQCLVDAILPIAPVPLSAWSALTTYAAGAGVTYAGSIWISLAAANLNHQPDVSPAWWVSVLSTSPQWTFDSKAADFNAALSPTAWVHYEVNTAGGNVIATLPAAAGNGRAEGFFIKTEAANSMIIAAADLVNGAASQTITGQWDAVAVRCTGSTWHVIG